MGGLANLTFNITARTIHMNTKSWVVVNIHNQFLVTDKSLNSERIRNSNLRHCRYRMKDS